MAVEITRTPSSNGNQKTWTFSVWLKGQDVTSGTAQNILSAFYGSSSRYANINITGSYTLEVFSGVYSTGASTTTSAYLVTNRVFRDPSAWWNIVVAYDTTNATSGDRVKIYINGVRETSFSTETYPSLNDDSFFNVTTTQNRIGASGGANVYKGLMTHMHFIDGTAYQASDFGQFNSNGVWTPKTSPSVTYGTNGFFFKFENSSNMDLDSSPNNHTFTTSGTLTQTLDTPSNVYCTMNPLNNPQGATFSNGNLKVANTFSDKSYGATLAFDTMKVYWEVKITTVGNRNSIGIIDTGFDFNSTSLTGNRALITVGIPATLTSGTHTGTVPSFSANDILCFAWDGVNNKLYYSQNANIDTASSNYFTISASEYTPAVFEGGGTTGINEFNFGNGYFGTTAVSSAGSNGNGSIFEYDVPSDFYALNTKNIAQYG